MNIFILGGECSGKTTLINKLLVHFSKQSIACGAVYEYLRHYCNQYQIPVRHQQQYIIACQQHQFNLWANLQQNPQKSTLNFIDTSALLTAIYSNLFLTQDAQRMDMRLWHLAMQQHMPTADNVVKTYVLQADIVWQQDGLRTNAKARQQTFEHIVQSMQALNLPFKILKTSTAFDVMIKELALDENGIC
jgi:nicotinamide riboside kinase